MEAINAQDSPGDCRRLLHSPDSGESEDEAGAGEVSELLSRGLSNHNQPLPPA